MSVASIVDKKQRVRNNRARKKLPQVERNDLFWNPLSNLRCTSIKVKFQKSKFDLSSAFAENIQFVMKLLTYM